MKQAIAANYLGILEKCMQQCGVDHFLEKAGFIHTNTTNPSSWLDLNEASILIKKAYELSSCPSLGLYFGQHLSIANHGFLGYAVMTSPTLRAAFQTFLNFLNVRTGLLKGYLYDDSSESAFVEFTLSSFDPLINRFLTEMAVAHLTRLCSFLTGTSCPYFLIEIAYAKPDYYDTYQQALGCNIRFDAPVTRVWFRAQELNARINFADEESFQQAKKQLQSLSDQLTEKNELPDRIRKILSAGEFYKFNMSCMANQLCMTPRTLRRHLQRFQITYQELFDEARCQKAKELLLNSALSITEISFLLGFHDVSSFSKAFRHWSNCTPTEYREH